MIGADMREHLRERLSELPTIARSVYNRPNISDPRTRFVTVAETVLYHFDTHNRATVATLMGMTERELVILLVGYIIGYGMGARPSPSCGE